MRRVPPPLPDESESGETLPSRRPREYRLAAHVGRDGRRRSRAPRSQLGQVRVRVADAGVGAPGGRPRGRRRQSAEHGSGRFCSSAGKICCPARVLPPRAVSTVRWWVPAPTNFAASFAAGREGPISSAARPASWLLSKLAPKTPGACGGMGVGRWGRRGAGSAYGCPAGRGASMQLREGEATAAIDQPIYTPGHARRRRAAAYGKRTRRALRATGRPHTGGGQR